MTKSMRQFFILTGNQNLLKRETSDDEFISAFAAGEVLIPLAANHYSVLSYRDISGDEWIDLVTDPNDIGRDLVLGRDWDRVKSVINLMATELYTKLGVNGLEGVSEGGLSQTITSNYSKGILTMINSQKRLRTIYV